MNNSIQILAATSRNKQHESSPSLTLSPRLPLMSHAKHEAPLAVGHLKRYDLTDGWAESKKIDNDWDRFSSHRLA